MDAFRPDTRLGNAVLCGLFLAAVATWALVLKGWWF